MPSRMQPVASHSQQPLRISRFRDIGSRNDTTGPEPKSLAFKDGVNLVTDSGYYWERLIDAMFESEADGALTIQGPEFRSLPHAFLVAGNCGIPNLFQAVLKYRGSEGTEALDLNVIAATITANLTILMRRKLEFALSKFSYLLGRDSLSRDSPFRVELDQNLRVSIFDAVSGNDIGVGFEAYGEQWVVYMASAHALRRYLFPDWDFPFVIGAIGRFDESIRRSLFEFAPSMSGQVILFEDASFYREMKTRPHLQLSQGEHSTVIRLTKARGYGLS